MAETFVTILTAHLIGDFIFQTGWMVRHKRSIKVMLLHVAIVTTLSCLFIGAFHWQILLAIFLIHFALDALKVYGMADSLRSFLIDQWTHVVSLIGLAWIFPYAATNGLWATSLTSGFSNYYFGCLSFLSGLILAVPAGGILIGKATRPFREEINEDIEGLEKGKGGLYIGWLERFLVMLFLLINQPTGIGFLIAAKSILRFGEIKNTGQRKVAEYIIIGTFLSFGWALSVSVLTQKAIQHWFPPKVSETPAASVIKTPSPTTQSLYPKISFM